MLDDNNDEKLATDVRLKDLPPYPPEGNIVRPQGKTEDVPEITFNPYQVESEIVEPEQKSRSAYWWIVLTAIMIILALLAMMLYQFFYGKDDIEEEVSFEWNDNPPATIAPAPPQEPSFDEQPPSGEEQGGQNGEGQDSSSSGGQSSGDTSEDTQDQTGSGGGQEGAGGSSSDSGRGQKGQAGTEGGQGSGDEGEGSGSSQAGEGEGSGGSSGGGENAPQQPPLLPPQTPGSGSDSSVAPPTRRDPKDLNETPASAEEPFMKLTLLPLGAEDAGYVMDSPQEGMARQTNTINLPDGTVITVQAWRGAGSRAMLEEYLGGEEPAVEVRYGKALIRKDGEIRLIGSFGARGELIGSIFKVKGNAKITDLETIANGMRFEFS